MIFGADFPPLSHIVNWPEKYDPKYVANAQNGSALVIVDQFIDDASFAMLREVSASYSLPDRWARYARATRASFTLAGDHVVRRDVTR